MIHLDELATWTERFAGLPMEPLRITVELASGLAGYDDLNLDNLLARCVVDRALAGARMADHDEDGYWLPIPLRCLWRDQRGYPLWAATTFSPDGHMVQSNVFHHKRQISGEWTGTKSGKFSVRSGAGRHAERRIPFPVRVAERWSASCIGNADAIAELLEPLQAIGKHRARGFGQVIRWIIEPMPAWRLVAGGHLARPLPVAAGGLLEAVPAARPVLAGWTPPQWKASLWDMCWPEGTVA